MAQLRCCRKYTNAGGACCSNKTIICKFPSGLKSILFKVEFFAAIGNEVAGRLCPVSKDAWTKYEGVKEANKQSDVESTWDLQRIEQKTVQRILHSLKANKATGLDKIPARLLKDAEEELAPSITYLVKKSISDGIVPDMGKVARVTPLYKSDDKPQVT